VINIIDNLNMINKQIGMFHNFGREKKGDSNPCLSCKHSTTGLPSQVSILFSVRYYND